MTKKIKFKIQSSFLGVYDYDFLNPNLRQDFVFKIINKSFLSASKNLMLSTTNAKVLGRSNIILNSTNIAAINGLSFSLSKEKIFGNDYSDFNLENNIEPVFNCSSEINIDSAVFIGSSSNIGHWLFNHLLKVAFLDEAQKKLKFLVSDNNLPKRYLDFFKVLGIENELIMLKAATLYNVNKIYLPMMPWHSTDAGFVNFCPNVIPFLRRFTLRKNNEEGLNVFISRKKALHRKLLNEEEITDYLRTKNFQIIFLEDLSLEKQMKIGNQAQNVICPWGAGSNFFIFMNKNSNLYELGPRDRMNITPLFCNYANVNNIQIAGKLIDQKNSLDCDFTIDIKDIKKIF